jgi:hypothetical protein
MRQLLQAVQDDATTLQVRSHVFTMLYVDQHERCEFTLFEGGRQHDCVVGLLMV